LADVGAYADDFPFIQARFITIYSPTSLQRNTKMWTAQTVSSCEGFPLLDRPAVLFTIDIK
jgi:hypothetical protein